MKTKTQGKRNQPRSTLMAAFGEHWPRVKENFVHLPRLEDKYHYGIYVLYDGTFPTYIGKVDRGSIRMRIRRQNQSERKSLYWDNFSWYAAKNREDVRELEALLLRVLSYYMRLLNRQGSRLNAKKISPEVKDMPKRKPPKALKNT